MDEVPFLASGNQVHSGDHVACPRCGGQHDLQPSIALPDGSVNETVLFYQCGDTSYVAALGGALLPGLSLMRAPHAVTSYREEQIEEWLQHGPWVPAPVALQLYSERNDARDAQADALAALGDLLVATRGEYGPSEQQDAHLAAAMDAADALLAQAAPGGPLYYHVLQDGEEIDSGMDWETAWARARDAKAQHPAAEVVIEQRRWRSVQAAPGAITVRTTAPERGRPLDYDWEADR